MEIDQITRPTDAPPHLEVLKLPYLEDLEYTDMSWGSQHRGLGLSLIVAPELKSLSLALDPSPHNLVQRFPALRTIIGTHPYAHSLTPEVVLDGLSDLALLEEIDIVDIEHIILSETNVDRLSSRETNGDWTMLPRLRRMLLSRDVDLHLAKRLLEARHTGGVGSPSFSIALVSEQYEYHVERDLPLEFGALFELMDGEPRRLPSVCLCGC